MKRHAMFFVSLAALFSVGCSGLKELCSRQPEPMVFTSGQFGRFRVFPDDRLGCSDISLATKATIRESFTECEAVERDITMDVDLGVDAPSGSIMVDELEDNLRQITYRNGRWRWRYVLINGECELELLDAPPKKAEAKLTKSL